MASEGGFKAGDVALRIWGDGFMITEMRVERVDDEFIYCDAQRSRGAEEWESVLTGDQERWRFDVTYGVETDEEQGWGIMPYANNIVLSRIVPPMED